jgi:hypothetical protein
MFYNHIISRDDATNFGDCHAVGIFAIVDTNIDYLLQLCQATAKILAG